MLFILETREKTKINPLSLLGTYKTTTNDITISICSDSHYYWRTFGRHRTRCHGGVGLGILTFVFGLQPTAPPIDVMLMIAAVISAASCMQAAGGLDYMVKLAEHLLRKNPSHVTLLSPLVTYLFTFIAGTGHVAYSVLPVIAEVATETKIRPERPLGIAVIASQQAITASPISAATVALLGLLAGFDITLFDILKITIPATIIGVLVGALFSMKSARTDRGSRISETLERRSFQ